MTSLAESDSYNQGYDVRLMQGRSHTLGLKRTPEDSSRDDINPKQGNFHAEMLTTYILSASSPGLFLSLSPSTVIDVGANSVHLGSFPRAVHPTYLFPKRSARFSAEWAFAFQGYIGQQGSRLLDFDPWQNQIDFGLEAPDQLFCGNGLVQSYLRPGTVSTLNYRVTSDTSTRLQASAVTVANSSSETLLLR